MIISVEKTPKIFRRDLSSPYQFFPAILSFETENLASGTCRRPSWEGGKGYAIDCHAITHKPVLAAGNITYKSKYDIFAKIKWFYP